MKNLSFLIVFYITMLCCTSTVPSNSADKVALIIAISEYAPDTGWSIIHGENDIELISSALIKRGFQRENIHILRGNTATKQEIRRRIIQLSEQVAVGGFFVLHFSGHGQQVEDRNGDEVDGLDEALVTYNGKTYATRHYQGEDHLLDEELRNYLSPLARQLGSTGQLLVLVDACHSGTVLRGDVKYHPTRGSNKPLLFSKQMIREENMVVDGGGFLIKEASNRKLNCEVILISATRPEQVNVEYFDRAEKKYYGPLSFAFARVFSQLNKNSNYQLLFEEIRREIGAITEYQTPTFEGNPSLIVGKNKLSPLHYYHSVVRILDPDEVVIDGGRVQQLHSGSEVVFYPAVRDTNSRSILRGKVIKSDLFQSTVVVEPFTPQQKQLLERAYVVKRNFGKMEVRVYLDINDKTLRQNIESVLDDVTMIKIVTNAPDILIQQNKNRNLDVIADQRIINSFSDITPNLSQQLIDDVILPYAQVQFLKQLTIDNPDYRLKGRLVCVQAQVGSDDIGNTKVVNSSPVPTNELRYNAEGLLRIPQRSFYQMEITNEGKKTAYFTVLDIQPDGKFQVAIPFKYSINNAMKTPEDYFIQPGETKIIADHYWMMGPPFGIEQYTIIATDKPINLTHIEQTRGKNATLSDHTFSHLFKCSWAQPTSEDKTRSGKMPPIVPEEVFIGRFFVEIVE